jgi:hypothetical protein
MMKDVATYCRWKFLVEAVMRIPIGALLLTVGALTPVMFAEDIRNRSRLSDHHGDGSDSPAAWLRDSHLA